MGDIDSLHESKVPGYFELTCLNYMYSKFQRTEKYFPAS